MKIGVNRRLIAAALATATLPLLTAGTASAQQLNGVFHIGAGSYIRMGLPSGGFFVNPYSKAANKTYTTFQPGSAGGIRTGTAQAAPSPAFDAHGDSLANSIIAPTNFTGIRFGVVTTVAPTFTVTGNRLVARLRHLYAEWNRQVFQQGAIVTGTYDSRTHHYSLSWRTKVHGGPFDGYTGYWHLQGTFTG